MERVILYIDGFNLFYGMKTARKDKGWPNNYWLNLEALGLTLLHSTQTLEAVKYFTARNTTGSGRANRQNQYFEALATLPLVEVFEGRMQSSQQSCRSCGVTWPVWKEKKTDVNIAVSLLVDAYEDRFDKALLITGDSDLVPPIEAVKRVGKKVVVCAPPFRFMNELKKMSSGFLNIRQAHLASNQLPDPAVKADGSLIHKPARWC